MGEIDKHAPDGVNKLLIGTKRDLTSHKELSTDEAKELKDSLNMRLSETIAKNAHNVEEACRSKSFDEIEDEAKMQTCQTVNNKCAGSLAQVEGEWVCLLDKHEAVDREGAVPRSNYNARGIVRGEVRKSDSTTTQNHHPQT